MRYKIHIGTLKNSNKIKKQKVFFNKVPETKKEPNRNFEENELNKREKKKFN